MKVTSLFTVLFFVAYGCTPKIKSSIVVKESPLPDTAYVLVLKLEDSFVNDGIEIGTIKSGDKGFTTNCSYFEVVANLRTLARQHGANVIKITEHRPASWKSTCDRMNVKLYRVPDLRKHEKEFEWTANRKLTWDDFKGEPKSDTAANVAALTYCGFGFQSNRASNFVPLKIFTTNFFNCYLSWVRPDQKYRPDLLQHEQSHFDLCEVYTRKLRKKLAESVTTPYHLNTKAKAIFEEISKAYTERQQLYDEQTRHGLDILQQKYWARTIEQELGQLSAYAVATLD